MISSVSVAAWIAHLAFWVMLGIGLWLEELRWRAAGLLLALWLAGYVGLPKLGLVASALVVPYVAVLDIALVFLVFKGDVRLR